MLKTTLLRTSTWWDPSPPPQSTPLLPSPPAPSAGVVTILRLVAGPTTVNVATNPAITSKNNKWGATVVVASSSPVNGSEQDHYAVLGVERTATSADIKKAYRLLARKYHPDVSKHSQACELFKSVRHAYEILSNELTRTQYDRALRFQEDTGRSFSKRQYHNPEVEDWVRIYKWAEMKRKMRSGARWEHHNLSDDPSFYSDTEEETFGSLLSLTFSSLMALFDRQLDAGYKIGYFIAWILGGRGGVLLVLCLQFASWACGKTSSSMVALVVVALCVGSNLARFAPLPQGALLTLLYMSIKLQADLN
ncbi:hypothetical protein OIU76_023916 [Salix suchowensis]|nr:hypothetical protein OIU76_023916 [Salix suchowensis]